MRGRERKRERGGEEEVKKERKNRNRGKYMNKRIIVRWRVDKKRKKEMDK